MASRRHHVRQSLHMASAPRTGLLSSAETQAELTASCWEGAAKKTSWGHLVSQLLGNSAQLLSSVGVFLLQA